uniref:Uncharacterized protein n=1 Tax=Rhizophora mucronata TaxID=61149 RepID=A0A2P2P8L1_RHIMU
MHAFVFTKFLLWRPKSSACRRERGSLVC